MTNAAPTLEGTAWHLTHGVDLPAGATITARLGGGTMAGSAGGQRYRVVYRLERDGERLAFGSPTMAGRTDDPGLAAATATFLQRLEAVVRVRIEADRLELLDRDGAYVLRFVTAPAVPDAIAGRWTVETVAAPEDQGSPSTGRGVPAAARSLELDRTGRASGSAGTDRFSGPARGDGDQLTLGPLTLDQGAGSPDVVDAELAFLSILESVAAVRADGARLHLLDGDGQTLVRMERAEGG